jgi:hypothetical protein
MLQYHNKSERENPRPIRALSRSSEQTYCRERLAAFSPAQGMGYAGSPGSLLAQARLRMHHIRNG